MTVKLRDAKSDGGTSGSRRRVMSGTSAMVATAPTASATKADGSAQRWASPRIAPYASPPTARATAIAPSQSKRSGTSGLRLSSRRVTAITTPAATKGMLMRNAMRQSNVSTRKPPMGGPRSSMALVAAVQMPKAAPRSGPENVALMRASEVGTSSAPNAPCASRARMSSSMCGARPHTREVTPNPARPMTNRRLRP